MDTDIADIHQADTDTDMADTDVSIGICQIYWLRDILVQANIKLLGQYGSKVFSTFKNLLKTFYVQLHNRV